MASHFTSNTDAILIVSNRNTQRYLLFDKDNRLVGWTHTGTGEIRTPYKELDLDACRKMAFAGIHIIGSRAIATMQDYPDAFSIIDCDNPVCRGKNNKSPMFIDGNEYSFLILPVNIGNGGVMDKIREHINRAA